MTNFLHLCGLVAAAGAALGVLLPRAYPKHFGFKDQD